MRWSTMGLRAWIAVAALVGMGAMAALPAGVAAQPRDPNTCSLDPYDVTE